MGSGAIGGPAGGMPGCTGAGAPPGGGIPGWVGGGGGGNGGGGCPKATPVATADPSRTNDATRTFLMLLYAPFAMATATRSWRALLLEL